MLKFESWDGGRWKKCGQPETHLPSWRWAATIMYAARSPLELSGRGSYLIVSELQKLYLLQ